MEMPTWYRTGPYGTGIDHGQGNERSRNFFKNGPVLYEPQRNFQIAKYKPSLPFDFLFISHKILLNA